MNPIQSWQLLLVAVAGWMNRHQQDVIDYIREENSILKSKLQGKRIRFTDDERRRLAVKARFLVRKRSSRCHQSSRPTRYSGGIESLSS